MLYLLSHFLTGTHSKSYILFCLLDLFGSKKVCTNKPSGASHLKIDIRREQRKHGIIETKNFCGDIFFHHRQLRFSIHTIWAQKQQHVSLPSNSFCIKLSTFRWSNSAILRDNTPHDFHYKVKAAKTSSHFFTKFFRLAIGSISLSTRRCQRRTPITKSESYSYSMAKCLDLTVTTPTCQT